MSSAAEQGSFLAQHDLALFHLRGTGTSVDAAKAAELFETSAMRGHAASQEKYAQMLTSGTGVERNPTLALSWFHISATLGNTLAAEKRDRLVRELNMEQVALANQRATAWLASHDSATLTAINSVD
jgi:hypothetical protein